MSLRKVKDVYHLKSSNFFLNPITDWKAFFGRGEFHQSLQKQMHGMLSTDVAPKIVLWGQWGLGKTHTLFNILNRILSGVSIPVYVECTEFRQKDSFVDFYRLLVESIGKDRLFQAIKKIYTTNPDFFNKPDIEPDFKTLCTQIIPYPSQELKDLAWRWIRADSPKDAMKSLGLYSNDVTTAQAEKILLSIGEIIYEAEGKLLIFLVDEAHRLKNIKSEDEYRELVGAFRHLTSAQSKVGFIFAVGAGDKNEFPEVLNEAEIMTRIGNYYIQLSTLQDNDVDDLIRGIIKYSRNGWNDSDDKLAPSADAVKDAIKELKSKKFNVSDETYPFTQEAIELLVEYYKKRTTDATPRNVSMTLNQCASDPKALGQGVITDSDVEACLALGEQQKGL